MKYVFLAPSRTAIQGEISDPDNHLYTVDAALHRYLTTASTLKDTTFVIAPAGDNYSLSLEDLANHTFNDESPSWNNSEFRKIDALKKYIESKEGKLDVVLTFDTHNPDRLVYDKIFEHHALSRIQSRRIGKSAFVAQLAEHTGVPESKYDTAEDFGYQNKTLCDKMEDLDDVDECSSSTIRSIRILARYLEHKILSRLPVEDEIFIFCFDTNVLIALDSVNLISVPEQLPASRTFKNVSETTDSRQLFRNDLEFIGIPNIKILVRRYLSEEVPEACLEAENKSIQSMMDSLGLSLAIQHNASFAGHFFKPVNEQKQDAPDCALESHPGYHP